MPGFVYKGSEIIRVTITRQQLEDIAKILKISAPAQVQGVSVHVGGRPPKAKRPARKKE